MKIAIFVPTNRCGGLDVLEASLQRQTYKDFVWIVQDEFYFQRRSTWQKIINRNDFEIEFLNVPLEEGKKRNLCASYNYAAEHAIESDLFVSLQDYIWLPPNGIERFVEVKKQFPGCLYTGVTHISADPFPNKVDDLEDPYTIFKKPFTEKPKRIGWEDVRISEIYTGYPEGAIVKAQPGHWEANWAAIDSDLLKNGLRWNEDYDYGIAYENVDFAMRADREFEAEILLDTGNVAISLPHKEYWPEEKQEIIDYSNRERCEKDWNI